MSFLCGTVNLILSFFITNCILFSSAQTVVRPENLVYNATFRDKNFTAVDMELTWVEAAEFCEKNWPRKSSHLAIVKDNETRRFIVQVFHSAQLPGGWIGLKNSPGKDETFQWVNGDPLESTEHFEWSASESIPPGDKCVEMWLPEWGTNAPETWYRDTCNVVHYGFVCQINSQGCETNGCKNGGKCVKNAKDESTYHCECVHPFFGENCESDIDDCENNLCQNGATCVDGHTNYTCACPYGFGGFYCDRNVSEVCPKGFSFIHAAKSCIYQSKAGAKSYTDAENVCEQLWPNSHILDVLTKEDIKPYLSLIESAPFSNVWLCAKARSTWTDYTGKEVSANHIHWATNGLGRNLCLTVGRSSGEISQSDCSSNYNVAFFCQAESLTCTNSTCANGGVCIPENLIDEGYWCQCAPGYEGPTCGQPKNGCVVNPCQNGGSCVPEGKTEFSCICPRLFQGKTCEILPPTTQSNTVSSGNVRTQTITQLPITTETSETTSTTALCSLQDDRTCSTSYNTKNSVLLSSFLFCGGGISVREMKAFLNQGLLEEIMHETVLSANKNIQIADLIIDLLLLTVFGVSIFIVYQHWKKMMIEHKLLACKFDGKRVAFENKNHYEVFDENINPQDVESTSKSNSGYVRF